MIVIFLLDDTSDSNFRYRKSRMNQFPKTVGDTGLAEHCGALLLDLPEIATAADANYHAMMILVIEKDDTGGCKACV